jgi:hypothetical protein
LSKSSTVYVSLNRPDQRVAPAEARGRPAADKRNGIGDGFMVVKMLFFAWLLLIFLGLLVSRERSGAATVSFGFAYL